MAITKIQSESLNLADTYAFTGTVTGAGGVNTPAFEAELSSTQSVSNNTTTKVQFNTEIFDTDNCYDNSTNYRFTPTVAGKYFAYIKVRCQGDSDSNLKDVSASIKKNTSIATEAFTLFRNNFERAHTVTASCVVDMNGSSDYLEGFGLVNVDGGSPSGFIGGGKKTTFGAFKIIE